MIETITDAGETGALILCIVLIACGLTVYRNRNADTARMAFRFACFVGVVAVASVAVWALGGPAAVAARFLP